MSLESAMLAQLRDNLLAYPQTRRWLVAFSGGLDSSVLLHLLVKANQQLPTPLQVLVVHINHGLSAEADQWQQHCESIAAGLGLSCLSRKVYIDKQGRGWEAAARAERYRVFESVLEQGDMLLLGQHRDDQAETLLLRLMRGSGVDGLAAMPAMRAIGAAVLQRPLLNCKREAIQAYAESQQLSWIEDESNRDSRFDRNFLRQQVLPLLTARWHDAAQQLSATAEHALESKAVLAELAAADLSRAGPRKERCGYSLDWHFIKSLSMGRGKLLIRYYCQQLGFTPPGAESSEQIQKQFFSSQSMLSSALVSWVNHQTNSQPNVDSGRIEIRQFHQRLYFMRALKPFDTEQAERLWYGKDQLNMGAAGILVCHSTKEGYKEADKDADKERHKQSHKENSEKDSGLLIPQRFLNEGVHIRWRRGGERCQPIKRQASQTIKKLLQEYQLETWLRDRVPLLYMNSELVAVGDCWLCQPFLPEPDEPMLRIKWFVED